MYMYVYIYIYTYTYIHTHIHTHIHIITYIYIHTSHVQFICLADIGQGAPADAAQQLEGLPVLADRL